MARERPPAWRATWRFRLVALLLLALLVAGAVQLFRVLSGATAQDPDINAAPAALVWAVPGAGGAVSYDMSKKNGTRLVLPVVGVDEPTDVLPRGSERGQGKGKGRAGSR